MYSSIGIEENFFSSMIRKKNFISVNKLEIQDMTITETNFKRLFSFTSIANQNLSLNLQLLLILSQKGQLISSLNFNNKKVFITPLINLVKNLVKNTSKNNSFFTISFAPNFYICIYHSHLNFAIISNNSKSNTINKNKQIYKLFLEFFSVSIYNFLGENSILLNDINYKNFNENYQLKLFELFFAFPLIHQYEIILKYLFSSKEKITYNDQNFDTSNAEYNQDLKYAKLKNCYVIDYINKEIVFDLGKTMNNKKKKKYYLNKQLLIDLLFQCDKLVKAFMSGIYSNETYTDFKNKYITIELSSTFPRLFFIVKFFPIYNGFIIIELYNIYRLSHNEDIHYNEYNIKYPNEIVSQYIQTSVVLSNDITKKIIENKKFVQFEDFIIEYFSCINSLTSMYISHKCELKYFDMHIMKTIDTLLEEKITFEEVITKTNQILFEHYCKIASGFAENKKAINNNASFKSQNDSFLLIDTIESYGEIFKDRNISFDIQSNDFSPIMTVVNGNVDRISEDNDKKMSDLNPPLLGENDNTLIGFDFNIGNNNNRRGESCSSSINGKSSNSLQYSNTKRGESTKNVIRYNSRVEKIEGKIALLKDLQQRLNKFEDNGNFFIKLPSIGKRKSFQLIRKGKNSNSKLMINNTIMENKNNSNNSNICEELLEKFYKDYLPNDKFTEETFRKKGNNS